VRHVGTVLLAAAVASSASAQVRTDSLEIASVSFPGARVFPKRLLATTVATTPTHCAAIAPLWMILSVVLGVGVGVIAGLYPAARAARLDPVVALRAE